ncbi:MAG: ABC transporter substrate-binding protein, partial [Thermoplasmata archaeon]|nr:ABC transporter substrate-binding protein [Thermoplasmata archaeon]
MVVVLVLIVAGIGVYFALRQSTTSSCGPGQRANICIDQAEIPDSLDPGVTFSTPGWAAVQQVYQGLVNYNGSSVTSFAGVLATNSGVVSYNPNTGFSTYTFQLRAGAVFSNGDPYNAYVQWYSMYRSLLLEQGPQFIQEQNFYSTNFDPSSPLSYYSPAANDSAANATLVNDLNSWNFASPNATAVQMMELPNQSFQVLSASSIALNLGYGYLASNYTYLLATISAPTSFAVDPAWIDAHGGIVEGAVNSYAASNLLGTGPFQLQNYNG